MWNTGKRPPSSRQAILGRLVVVIGAALLSCCSLLGCPALPEFPPPVSFEYLDISCSVGEEESYYEGETVRLSFSIQPDPGETERNLTLSEGGMIRQTVFTWDGRDLYIKPLTGWKKGEHYYISLEGRLRMKDGRGYTTGIVRSFIYGREGNEFNLASSGMEGDCLIFNFSKVPGTTSFTELFSLSPDTEYFCDFLGETVRVQPKSSWRINTTYTWTIKDMESTDGYRMKGDYSGSFSGPADPDVPRPVELCPVSRQLIPGSGLPHLWKRGTCLDGNLEQGEGIGFIFSKPMDSGSLRSGISFYPSIKGYFETAGDNAIVFFPEEAYQPETEYRITLSSGIQDSLGLGLFEEFRYYFTSSHHYLEVEKLNLDSRPEPLLPGGIVQDHFLLSLSPPSLEVGISFSQAIPPANRKAAADSVALSVLFPLSAHNPFLISAQWKDGGSLLSLVYEDLSPSGGGVDNYYQIKISSGKQGPVNGSGEYLKEDLWYVFAVR
jgi:hypothetical protein